MKIRIFSDLHLEFQGYEPPAADSDVVVLAGDVHTKGRALDWIRKHFSGPVIYVLGNHDYWGENLTKLPAKLRERVTGESIHVLEGNSVVIDGVRFYGASFWTDFELYGKREHAMYEAQTRMYDYKKIRHSPDYKRFTPQTAFRKHFEVRLAMKKWLGEPFDGKTVVVSHHAPSVRSLEISGEGGALDASYASNLEEYMGPGLDLWIHGHVHDSMDYTINGTRVVCNPRGYGPKHLNRGFRDTFIVEV
jgi:predicted phosphodiesterase